MNRPKSATTSSDIEGLCRALNQSIPEDTAAAALFLEGLSERAELAMMKLWLRLDALLNEPPLQVPLFTDDEDGF